MSMTRGQLAKRCGVNVETLRYYEKRDLLPKPQRTASNYRLYDEGMVRRVRFVKRAKELGFTLSEIKELLSLRARPGATCADVQARAAEKLRDIDGKIRALQGMRRALVTLTSECRGEAPVSACPILESLDAIDHSLSTANLSTTSLSTASNEEHGT